MLLARLAADTKFMCSCCVFILLLNTFSPQATDTSSDTLAERWSFQKLGILGKFPEKNPAQPTNTKQNITKSNKLKQIKTKTNKQKKITHTKNLPPPFKNKRKAKKTKSRLRQGREETEEVWSVSHGHYSFNRVRNLLISMFQPYMGTI